MVIPFYGSSNPEVFAIERRAMDRPGRVLEALDGRLPSSGAVVDVGAGDGFCAGRLTTGRRTVVAVEPALGLRRTDQALPWIGGIAQALPLRTGSLSGAFSTWAYFFTGEGWDPSPGIAELHRVVGPGGPLLVVDNLGGDDLTALAGSSSIAASVEQWAELGFGCDVIDTMFEFDSEEEARTLLTFYFGELEIAPPTTLSHRLGLFSATSLGQGGEVQVASCSTKRSSWRRLRHS